MTWQRYITYPDTHISRILCVHRDTSKGKGTKIFWRKTIERGENFISKRSTICTKYRILFPSVSQSQGRVQKVKVVKGSTHRYITTLYKNMTFVVTWCGSKRTLSFLTTIHSSSQTPPFSYKECRDLNQDEYWDPLHYTLSSVQTRRSLLDFPTSFYLPPNSDRFPVPAPISNSLPDPSSFLHTST